MSRTNEKDQRGRVGADDKVRTIEVIISFILIVIGTVLLARMHHSEVIVNTTYDLDLGVRLHPFNLRVQFSSLYGLTGTMLLFLAGCMLKKGKRSLHVNVLCFALFDLFMYPSIIKSSKTYAMLEWGYDHDTIWKVYNMNTVALILLGVTLIVLFIMESFGKKQAIQKWVNVVTVALGLMACIDIILKAFTNPWYIYFSTGLFCANLVVGKLYQVILLNGGK